MRAQSIEFNECLGLHSRIQQPDGSGGYVESWVTLGHLWGKVEAKAGSSVSGQTLPLVKNAYRITLRYAPMHAPTRPKAGQRFVTQNRILEITSVIEADTERRYLQCTAIEETTL